MMTQMLVGTRRSYRTTIQNNIDLEHASSGHGNRVLCSVSRWVLCWGAAQGQSAQDRLPGHDPCLLSAALRNRPHAAAGPDAVLQVNGEQLVKMGPLWMTQVPTAVYPSRSSLVAGDSMHP